MDIYIEMLENRTINGKSLVRGEKLDMDEEKANFLIARKEAQLAKKEKVKKPLSKVEVPEEIDAKDVV